MLNTFNPRGFAATVALLVVGAVPLEGQPLSQYREFALGNSVAAVVAASGASAESIKTLHTRPASIQELEWRGTYARTPGAAVDPVRLVTFSFYDDQLYRVVVTYHANRTQGLTDADLIDALSALYGAPLPADTKASRSPSASSPEPVDTMVVARWESPEASLTLRRNTFYTDVTLSLVSKALSVKAEDAARKAVRLDVQEAPQREKALAVKEAADARTVLDTARGVNKATFRP